MESLTVNGNDSPTDKDNYSPRSENFSGRRLLVIRHGERVDFTFNPTHEHWVNRAFDRNGVYRRFNINMPRTLPQRKDGHASYSFDTPLTEMGYLQAKLTGRALKDASCKPTYIYASSAYRSIQTAVGIVKGLGIAPGKLKINIEPGLFEWGGWFGSIPGFMTPDELSNSGYPIDLTYRPLMTPKELLASESLVDYYNRSYSVTKRLLDKHPEECTIAFVAHGASLDTCTRQLSNLAPRNEKDFYSILHQTPYLALANCREDAKTKQWQLCDPPIYPFQHQGNAPYDWRQLQS